METIDKLLGISNGVWMLHVFIIIGLAGTYLPSKWDTKELSGIMEGDENRLKLAVKVHHWPGMILPIFASVATMVAQFRPDGPRDDIWLQISLIGLALQLVVWGVTLTVPALASMKRDLKNARLIFEENEARNFED